VVKNTNKGAAVYNNIFELITCNKGFPAYRQAGTQEL
jgi:hypothetical protein